MIPQFLAKNEANIEKNVFAALNTLEKWFSKNNLMLNINKTQIIKFSQKTNNNVILTNGAINLATSSSISFLGIEIDSRLDWKKQIEKLSLNIAHYCYALRVLSNSIGKFAAINVYHAYIQSRLRYGIIFWATSTDSNKIFILQKRCLRAVFGLRQIESCKMVFVENKVLTLYSLYIYEAIMFVVENKSLFRDRNHIYSTRNKNDLLCYTPTCTYIQKNVYHSIIQIYNKLPPADRNLPKKILKNKLKTFLIQRAYYTIDEYISDTIVFI